MPNATVIYHEACDLCGRLIQPHGESFESRGMSCRDCRFDSKLIYLDDRSIRGFRAIPVPHSNSGHEYKNAIDALYRWFKPDYVMILGSSDVVPHIQISKLTGDEDGLIIDSDLPYACDRPFHKNSRHFLSPTRVLGRLPDINGGRSPDYLVRLLENAATLTKRPRTDYEAWFGLSARVWTASSAITSANLFSGLDGLALCPPDGRGQHRNLDKTRIHFFNCHGDTGKHMFWGEEGTVQPPGFSSDDVPSQLLEGTFVAAECCYYENLKSRKGRKRPPAIVFKESDGQIEVRVYVPK